jgi:biopolymer transport protein ExbB/TolQ
MINALKTMALTGGEWVIYVLIICSVIAIAIMIERAIILHRERKSLGRIKILFDKYMENKNAKDAEDLSQIQTLSSRVLYSGISQISHGVSSVEEHMSSVTFGEKQRLEKRLIILGTLGNNAVYIGLFGTVLGVIKAFHDLAQEGSAGPEVVMQGLSEALIATAVGLLVALPCVIAFNILQKQIKDILAETEAMARLFLAHLKSEK